MKQVSFISPFFFFLPSSLPTSIVDADADQFFFLDLLKTTWNQPCARPTCMKPISNHSKYCGDWCGVEVAAARLELSGLDPARLWDSVAGAKRKQVVIDGNGSSITEKRTSSELETQLVDTLAKIKALEVKGTFISSRLRYLKIAVRRWQAICHATAQQLAAEGLGKQTKNQKKKVGPVGAVNAPEAQCGMDSRLVYDDLEWQRWLENEGKEVLGDSESREGSGTPLAGLGMEIIDGVCLNLRKKCQHSGWQQVKEADFDVELAVVVSLFLYFRGIY